MEYLIAFLILALSIAYAIFIAVNIERGRPWALEIARAVAMLDPHGLDRHFQSQIEAEPRANEGPEPTPSSSRMAA